MAVFLCVLFAAGSATIACRYFWRIAPMKTGFLSKRHLLSTSPRSTLTQPPSAPGRGSGGPILVLTDPVKPFTSYYAEILRNEGFNEFAVEDLAAITTATLSRYDVAILGEMPLNGRQAELLLAWVRDGGSLIAMRPARPLLQALQIEVAAEPLQDRYLSIDTQNGPGSGLVSDSIQFHGDADRYTLRDGVTIATLDIDENTPSPSPAVWRNNVGRGQVVVFAYDLARSVIFTRQGNPAWSGLERDGLAPVRSDDLFFGAAPDDPQPDWVDMNRVAIPQADEQQRLLANIILEMAAGKLALPRFWYFPRGLKAVVVMTGDDHGHGGTVGRFQQFQSASPSGCSVSDWECVRGTSNIFPGSITPEDAVAATEDGFEIGLHIFTDCQNWPSETTQAADGHTIMRMSRSKAASIYSLQLNAFLSLYPGLPKPSTSRTDCIAWGDFDSQPQVEMAEGIRLDTNYYYWPAAWVRNRPGLFTGSGMPMRFAKVDGSLIDVYQAATQMTDESGQAYPFTIDTLLDNALGPREYYGAFTANIHTDLPRSKAADAILASTRRRGVPVISALQMLTWLDGRNASFFRDITWSSGQLHFTVVKGRGADGLTALLPMESGSDRLARLETGGSPVPFQRLRFAGVDYAEFPAGNGSYAATYQAR